jgi:NADH:ubiquinone oxidoreductase subunit 5 (subunit L)/multisubunit Na+/H+ antiporter MnhA subunit
MFGSALTLASSVKILHSIFLSRLPEKLKETREVPWVQTGPMLILAGLCVFFGVFYTIPLRYFIYPALGIEEGMAIFGTWDSVLATALLLIGILLGLGVLAVGALARTAREVPTWVCGEKLAEEQMVIPGSHFYKTISSMGGLRGLYSAQEKEYFDPYNQSGRVGLAFTGFLRFLHNGVLPMYLTWVTLGLLVILFVICGVW